MDMIIITISKDIWVMHAQTQIYKNLRYVKAPELWAVLLNLPQNIRG